MNEKMPGELSVGPPAALDPLEREFAAGSWLFRSGQVRSHLFIISNGVVKLVERDANGHEAIVGLRTKGSVVGFDLNQSDHRHRFDALACTACKITEIKCKDLLRQVSDPHLEAWCLAIQTREISDLVNWISMTRLVNPCSRLCRLLRILSESFIDDISLRDGGLRRYEVAQAVGVSREHLSRLVAKMKRQGVLIEAHGKLLLASHNMPAIKRAKRRSAYANQEP